MTLTSLNSFSVQPLTLIDKTKKKQVLGKKFQRLLLTVCFVYFSNTLLASEHETRNGSTGRILKYTQQIDWDKLEAQDKQKQVVWYNQQANFDGYDTPGDVAPVVTALSHLGLNEKPLAVGQKTYVESPTGQTTMTRYKNAPDSLCVRDFGLSPTKTGYVAKDGVEHRETFTPTLSKGNTYKHGRKHPFKAFSLVVDGVKINFDAGHGIDQADTVVANGRNSSTDPDNFVPQNRYYNQYIRNHKVNHVIRKLPAGAYKEVSIYDMASPLIHTLSNGENCHIPIGFLFFIFENHEVSRVFYFPNLISYEQLVKEQKIEEDYRKLMDFFEISKDVLLNDAVKMGDPDQQTRAVGDHEYRGYRALSGRYDVAQHLKIPRPAKAALRRLLAIYDMEKAAHLEYRCVENKAVLVNMFTRDMKYYALDRASKAEQEQRDKAYWQAYADEQVELDKLLGSDSVDLIDYAISMESFLLRIHNRIPENDPRELALKRIQKRHEELERGQSLYHPERAKIWLARIEQSVSDSPQIEDIIRLLSLYDIPEVRDEKKRHLFEDRLEVAGAKASLEEQKDIGDYFAEQLKEGVRPGEGQALQAKVNYWRDVVEQRINQSTSIEELTEAAEWYHGGRGMFPKDPDKARALYRVLFPFVGKSEQRRIRHCLDDLRKYEDYLQRKKSSVLIEAY